MTIQKQPCVECGALILQTTAADTGGKCIPCHRGTRASIEESKKRQAEERRRRDIKNEKLQRIRERDCPTFRDFLEDKDPLSLLWPILLELAYPPPGRAESLDALGLEARAIYVAEVLAGEVFNGGFSQYLSNSSGEHAHESLRALRTLGAFEAARLLAKAIDAFPENRVTRDRMLRCEQLEAIEKERPSFFGELDTRYYALTSTEPPKEDAGQLMLSFMRKHPDAPIRKVNTA